MSVFDTFYLLFESDASKLTEGMDSAKREGQKVKDKMTEVDKKAAELGTKFKSIVKNAASIVIGHLALSSLKAMTLETVAHNVQLGKQAAALRMNVEKMQAWQHVFESAGSSAQTFNGLMTRIGQSTRDPEARLFRIAETMRRMSDTQKRYYGKSLGLEPEAIALLGKGKNGIEELLKRERELGLVTREQIKASREYNEQMRVFTRLLGDVRNRIGLWALPALNWLTEKFSKFIRAVRDNKAFIVGLFGAAAAMIIKFYLPAILQATGAIMGWAAPFLLIAAKAALIALILDDIYVYLQGGDSMIGRWIAKYEKIYATARLIKFILGGWKLILDSLIGKTDDLQRAIEGVVRVFTNYKDFFGFAMHLIGKYEVEKEQKIDPKQLKAEQDARALRESAANGKKILEQTNTPLAAQTSNVVNNSRNANVNRTNTVTIQNVNVQTQATDTDGIAKGIEQSLQQQLSGATYQFDDGVAA
jgi:hypothetical protein